MNKKLILLILCLPLVLMLSLFSVSNTVKISISVPVSKIEILGDKFVYLDLDKNEKYSVDYAVYPTNAKNKKVYFQTEQVGGYPLAELEYVDGKVVAKSCGKAKVYLTTVDGGFRDSFIVQVDSNQLQSINCVIAQSSIYVGDSTVINTFFAPVDTTDTMLEYQVSDQYKNIVSVSATGVVTGISKGNAEIVVVSVQNPDIKCVVNIEVKNKDIIDFEKSEVVTWKRQGSINISLDTEEQCTFAYNVYDQNNQLLDYEIVEVELNLDNISNDRLSVNYVIKDENFDETITIEVIATTDSGLVVTKACTISPINQIQAQFISPNIASLMSGATTIQPFNVTPDDVDVVFECSVSNDNITAVVDPNNKLVRITGNKIGVSIISLNVYNKENTDEYVTITKEVVVKPASINVNESALTYGIENLLAIGKVEVDGTTSKYNLTLSYGGSAVGENFESNITWISSSVNASISDSGEITLNASSGNEIVSFKAVFEYKGIIIESEAFNIKCVYDGVNVRNYLDLYNATNVVNPSPIILHNDIKDDFGKGVNVCYKEIETTYDKTYYENIGKADKAKIKVLIEFKNDVYGNGHVINAHNVAWKQNLQNATTNAIFNGPLNFVAMSESGGMVSVKAQDNVCFAVYEDVTLTNIELKGCDLQADANNEYDLSDLTYCGTVVEVFGDKVNIKYSRITNGRTVLRAFGDIEDKTKAINLNIQNSVLSGAREFILRLGTNCFVDGTKQNPSPNLPNDSGTNFPKQKTYESMTEQEKQDYDNAFIKTFVNIKNSVFKDAGIFAIGLDTHFAGTALADGSSYLGGLVKDWYNLAKTSYGVKLSFEGDVRLYNWKKLSDVDSSTLIEVHGSTTFTDISFDVGEMVDIISQNEKFPDILYKDPANGQKYVHAGIAFFGGGKNYSVFEGNNSIDDQREFNGYEIGLSDVNKNTLEVAAGNNKFYFLINDNSTKQFLPYHQEEILQSNDAYACIYK